MELLRHIMTAEQQSHLLQHMRDALPAANNLMPAAFLPPASAAAASSSFPFSANDEFASSASAPHHHKSSSASSLPSASFAQSPSNAAYGSLLQHYLLDKVADGYGGVGGGVEGRGDSSSGSSHGEDTEPELSDMESEDGIVADSRGRARKIRRKHEQTQQPHRRVKQEKQQQPQTQSRSSAACATPSTARSVFRKGASSGLHPAISVTPVSSPSLSSARSGSKGVARPPSIRIPQPSMLPGAGAASSLERSPLTPWSPFTPLSPITPLSPLTPQQQQQQARGSQQPRHLSSQQQQQQQQQQQAAPISASSRHQHLALPISASSAPASQNGQMVPSSAVDLSPRFVLPASSPLLHQQSYPQTPQSAYFQHAGVTPFWPPPPSTPDMVAYHSGSAAAASRTPFSNGPAPLLHCLSMPAGMSPMHSSHYHHPQYLPPLGMQPFHPGAAPHQHAQLQHGNYGLSMSPPPPPMPFNPHQMGQWRPVAYPNPSPASSPPPLQPAFSPAAPAAPRKPSPSELIVNPHLAVSASAPSSTSSSSASTAPSSVGSRKRKLSQPAVATTSEDESTSCSDDEEQAAGSGGVKQEDEGEQEEDEDEEDERRSSSPQSSFHASSQAETMHSCPFTSCNKAFLKPSALKRHVRTHTGERPFVCSVQGCGLSFAERGNLKRHERVHSGVKPFRCDVCSHDFARRCHLIQHLKAKHPNALQANADD